VVKEGQCRAAMLECCQAPYPCLSEGLSIREYSADAQGNKPCCVPCQEQMLAVLDHGLLGRGVIIAAMSFQVARTSPILGLGSSNACTIITTTQCLSCLLEWPVHEHQLLTRTAAKTVAALCASRWLAPTLLRLASGVHGLSNLPGYG
jgi:hypothetical protein